MVLGTEDKGINQLVGRSNASRSLGGSHLESIHIDSAAAEVCAREHIEQYMNINWGSYDPAVYIHVFAQLFSWAQTSACS